MKKKYNRYVMCYSQAECGYCVVYARCLEEAEKKWEDGEYIVEHNEND